MAIPLLRATKTAGAANWMIGSVYIDAESVTHVIKAIHFSISGLGLVPFFEDMVAPYLEDQIVDRFAGNGGGAVPGGAWAPLEATTIKIRNALGYYSDDAVNERTGELLSHLLTHEIDNFGVGAQIRVPESGYDHVIERKLRTAQSGYTQGPNDMIPGAYTPPRPVLALDRADVVAVIKMLQIHIATSTSNQFATIGTFP